MNPSKSTPSVYADVFPPESQFHNPYTFKPFGGHPPDLNTPNLLTDDEQEKTRFTGVLELSVETISPLLTMESKASGQVDGTSSGGQAKTSTPAPAKALTIGPDVIVPATSVRGALRTLLTLLTGGTLPIMDDSAHLCQGRDAALGPRGKSSPPGTPEKCFLARVIKAGSRDRDGQIELGDTVLVKAEDLFGLVRGLENMRPTSVVGKKKIFIDSPSKPRKVSDKESPQTPWEIKLSGRPVNKKGKREGAFKGNGTEIDIPAHFWEEYTGRHRHAVRPELCLGDLIWLEPERADLPTIKSAADIASLQWARWGRKGQRMMDMLPQNRQPDYRNAEGLVDEITNLFGLVSPERDSRIQPFAGRVRPENLVFHDAACKLLSNVQLAPLAAPHPGCRAFYRNTQSPEMLSAKQNLRGYKVYRTTTETGPAAPWHYQSQPIFDEKGQPLPPEKQIITKIVDLTPAGTTGTLRIALRSLSSREMALILLACRLPWRLGGGKPFGLGHCQIKAVRLLDEYGQTVDVKSKLATKLDNAIEDAANWWIASQKPVSKLRYPRAVTRNNSGVSRGGHVWFSQHATPRKGTSRDAEEKPGLEPLRLDGKNLPGQILLPLNPQDPAADILYGYDVEITEEKASKGTEKKVLEIRMFDPTHNTGREASSGNTSQNRQTRQDERAGRTAAPAAAPIVKTPVVGSVLRFRLIEEKTKKGGWKAQCIEPGHEPVKGFIVNSADVPADLQPGAEIELKIGPPQALQKEYQLRYMKTDLSRK